MNKLPLFVPILGARLLLLIINRAIKARHSHLALTINSGTLLTITETTIINYSDNKRNPTDIPQFIGKILVKLMTIRME